MLSDWITKTKSKLYNLKIDEKSTGGGPSSGNDLSDIEIRLMNLKGWSCVVGDNCTTEAGFGQVSMYYLHWIHCILTLYNLLLVIKRSSSTRRRG